MVLWYDELVLPRQVMLWPSNVFPDRFSDLSTVFILMTSHISLMPSGPSPQLLSSSDVRTLLSCIILPGIEKFITVKRL